MRFVLACVIALGFMVGSAGVIEPAAMAASGYAVTVDQQQPPSGQIDVDIRTDGGSDWWLSPFWIGIGVVALIVVIAVIAMASRGGGTTVIKG
jgi:hypothetical protein